MTTGNEKSRLTGIASEYFTFVPDQEEKARREKQYQAFKARLCLELRVSGGCWEGVVYGNVE